MKLTTVSTAVLMPFDEFLAEDFQSLSETVIARCKKVDGKRIYLSGSTGFFGKNLLALFAYLNRLGASFEVTALSRAPDAFVDRHAWCRGYSWLKWRQGNMLNPWPGDGSYDLVLHAATDTAASFHVNMLDVFDTILGGTRQALAFATRHGVQRMLLCGSGAEYGRISADHINGIPESSANACDPTVGGSAYGEAKRASETLAAIYAQRYGFSVIITRCFAFVGPGFPLDGHFAIGNFLRATLSGRAVELSSTGRAIRSYLYSTDLAVWLVTLLLEAAAGTTVNIGSDHGISIIQLATRVRDLINPHLVINTGKAQVDEERSFYCPCIERAKAFGLDVWTGLDKAITRTALWHGRSVPNAIIPLIEM